MEEQKQRGLLRLAPVFQGGIVVVRATRMALVLLVALSANTALQAQDIEWIRQFGGMNASGGIWNDGANSVATDGDGSAYVAGYTAGTIPGQTSQGDYDAVVRKYDSAGNEIWTRQFGSEKWDHATGVALDSTGVYVSGRTRGTLPGQTGTGTDSAFVRKYGFDGTELWTRQFSASSSASAYCISADGTGVYVGGMVWGYLSGQTSAGRSDAFIRKYDPDGNELWTQQFGTAAEDSVAGILTRSSELCVAGSTSGTLPGQTSQGGYDAFVRKYDSAGNEIWTRQFGTANTDRARGVVMNSTGVYVVGTTSGETVAGKDDAFVWKYDSMGNEEWGFQFGTDGRDWADAITLDTSGIYVAGMTGGSLSGQPKVGVEDAFVRKYDFTGNELWTRQFGSPKWTYATGVSWDSTGLYVAGYGEGALPGNVSPVHYEAFLAKFTVNAPPVSDAGADQAVHPGAVVTLDGSGSSDPEGNYPLTYAWQIISQPAGSAVELLNADTVTPTFVPDRLGDYTIQLIVTDSLGLQSQPDTVVVSTFNTAPVADAGPDQALLYLHTTVQLNGTQSYDDEGDPFFYDWEFVQQPAASLATLNGATTGTPTFVADVYGEYVIRLTVTDIFGAVSAPDTVTVSFANVKPVANAGGNQAVVVGQTVLLDGSGSSDANGDPLTFHWSFVSKPDNSQAALAAPIAVQTSFVPDWPGTYVVSLVVNDGLLNSEPNNVTIQAISGQDGVRAKLMELIARINALPTEAFKNENMRHALTSKLNAALAMLENQAYAAVLNKLESDLLPKTDGCATNGIPDANDWIKDCANQAQVYPLILETIALLRPLL